MAEDEKLTLSLNKEEFNREITKTILNVIRLTLGIQQQRELIRIFAISSIPTVEEKTIARADSYQQVLEKLNLNKEKSQENIVEKEKEIDKRIVFMQTYNGFTSLDTTNSKNEGAGATYDIIPVNDSSRYHFYHNYEEVSKKFHKDNKPFTFTYTRDGKTYLYATAGLNDFSGKSQGGRYGNIFASVELTKDLPIWAEKYLLKKTIDLANEKFGKDFETPIVFKEEYLSNLITPSV